MKAVSLLIGLFLLLLVGSVLAVEPAGKAAPKTGALVGKVLDRNGKVYEGARIFVNVNKPSKDSNMTQIAQGTTGADGTFQITVEAQDGLVINFFGKGKDTDLWAVTDISVKADTKTDLGTIQLVPMRM